MRKVVVPQAEQLWLLLAQQGDQRLPLAAGIGSEDRDRRLLGIAMDVAVAELVAQGGEQGAGRSSVQLQRHPAMAQR
ncbi:MAG: hypothetical protein RLZZ117_2298 [Cyanobacteriota bacterium]